MIMIMMVVSMVMDAVAAVVGVRISSTITFNSSTSDSGSTKTVL